MEEQRKRRQRLELKALLFYALGGRCEKCGAVERLEIDHIEGRDWEPRRVGVCQRWRTYWLEFVLACLEQGGMLRLLCRWCNAGYRPPDKRGRRRLERERYDTGAFTWR